MKRHSLDPGNFSLLKLLDEYARIHSKSIMDLSVRTELVERFRLSLNEHIGHKARIHGFRTESMFAHVVAAMDSCLLISEEDSGLFMDTEGTLRRPDFRIVTRDRSQLFVEVKNHHQRSNVREPLRIKGHYLSSLKRYSSLSNTPLKIAVYWSRWNLWTLLNADRMDENKEVIEIQMSEAVLHNEMYIFGDCLLGTEPPLSFRVYSDPKTPRKANPIGVSKFKVAKACLCAAGEIIEDPIERRIAWYLIRYGGWHEIEEHAHIVDGEVLYFETRFQPSLPEGADETQPPFSSLGYLSQMIASQYRTATTEDRVIKSLSPVKQPNELGLLIPPTYKGTVLKLWRFTMLPKHAKS